MLSDPDLPMLPLPTANFVTRPPFKYFVGHHPLTRAWEPTPEALPRPRRRISRLLRKQALGGGYTGTGRQVLSCVAKAGHDTDIHFFFFFTVPPFLT